MSGEDSVLVRTTTTMMFHMAMVTRKLTLVKFQSLMEILKNSLGGKPTSTVMSWV